MAGCGWLREPIAMFQFTLPLLPPTKATSAGA